LVQGGLDMVDHPALRQVAVLHIEPLHLLVKAEIHRAVARNLAGLRGKVVNLGERGSGTYLLATAVMAFSGLRAGIDYTESTQLCRSGARDRGVTLPDAVFSSRPSLANRPPPGQRSTTTGSCRCRSARHSPLSARTRPAPPHPRARATRIDRRHVYDAITASRLRDRA
jgi:hypothetical protein